MVWLPVFGVFNMYMDVDAVCDCILGLYKHQESTLEVDCG